MCTIHVFLGLVQVLDIWQLEGRSSTQAAAKSIFHIWWQQWDPSLTVVQGDPWIQNECGDRTDRGGPKKEGWQHIQKW